MVFEQGRETVLPAWLAGRRQFHHANWLTSLRLEKMQPRRQGQAHSDKLQRMITARRRDGDGASLALFTTIITTTKSTLVSSTYEDIPYFEFGLDIQRLLSTRLEPLNSPLSVCRFQRFRWFCPRMLCLKAFWECVESRISSKTG